jgi:hypothetical protein
MNYAEGHSTDTLPRKPNPSEAAWSALMGGAITFVGVSLLLAAATVGVDAEDLQKQPVAALEAAR